MKKERWIPAGYTEYRPDLGDYPKDLFAVYVDLDKISAIFYAGKQTNHTWFNRFHTVEDMKKKINTTISNLMSWEDAKLARKEARKAPHNLKVGDILYSSWGYDQTNINFYQVTAVVGKNSVKIREIASRIESSSVGADYVVAVKDGFLSPRAEWDNTGKEMLKRVSSSNLIHVSECQTAWPWDGKPMYETASGYGH